MKKNLVLLLVSLFIVFAFQSALISIQSIKRKDPQLDALSSEENKNAVDISVLDTTGAVVSMQLDDYLTGVVLCEMPVQFSIEALKAQAIVARTYALRRINNPKHDKGVVCTEASCCQGYRSETEYLKSGGTQQDVEKVRSAVTDTKNIVLVYNGSLIDATYFSCSGGMTEDAVAVWGKDIAYLQATESPGEEIATHHTDIVRYEADELSELLAISSDKPPSVWVESVTYTAGGGVNEMKICGKEISGIELRKILSLRSTAFTISFEDPQFVITTKGYGHRVGMSQYGAEAMALKGASCEEILLHYYKGVKLSQYAPAD